MDNIYTLGIDIGSTASKCVMLRDGKEIVSKSLISVGAGTSGPQRAIAEVLESAGMTREQMAYVLATGYGRNSLEGIADHQNIIAAIERCDLAAFEPLVERHLYGGIRRLGSKLTEEYADYFEPEK